MTSSAANSRVTRYRVEYWHDQPDVGYAAALGASARRMACYNAKNYGGRVVVDYSDGTSEEIQPYGGQSTSTQKAAA